MVRITLRRDGQGRVLVLTCEGHAEFSDDEHGGDIVCAAISALTGYLGITVSEVLDWPSSVSASDGAFHFCWPEAGSAEQLFCLSIILEGIVRSLRGLEENYSGWVKIEETSP